MVRAWPFEQLLEEVRGTLDGLLASLTVDSGHERALTPLFVLLLVGTVGGAFAGILILLRLAFEAVENCFDSLLVRGVASGDVKEFLGGSRALTSLLVDQGLTGGPRQEGSYHVGVGDVG